MTGPSSTPRGAPPLHTLLPPARRAIATAWRRPALAGLAVLAAVIAFAYTGVARLDLTQRTNAEHVLIHAAAPLDDAFTAVATTGSFGGLSVTASAQIGTIRSQIYRWISGSVPLDPADESWGGVDVPPVRMPLDQTPSTAQPSGGLTPQLDVSYRDTLPAHAKLVAGRWPSTAEVKVPPPGAEPAPVVLESVISTATAKLLGAHPGTAVDVHVRTLNTTADFRLLIVGVFEPADPAAAFWSSASYLAAPLYHAPLTSPPYWSAGVLVGSAQADYLMSAFGNDAVVSFAFPIDSDATDADGAGALSASVDRLVQAAASQYAWQTLSLPAGGSANPGLPDLGVSLGLASQLPSRLAPFLAAERVEGLELAMPLAGLALIAAVAAVLLAAAAVDERAGELAARRARGASARQAAARVLVDGLVTALPAAALGTAAALALPGRLPAGVLQTTLIAASLPAVAPALGVAWAEAVRRRATRLAARERPRAGAAARWWVVHAALLLICAGGLDLIRTQGLDPGGATDPYAAAAPVLAAVPMALATLDLLPRALRALLRRAASRRGPVGLLGVAQAADAPLPVQAADLVVTGGVSTAGLTFAISRLSRQGADSVLAAATHVTFTALAWTTVGAALLAVALAARLGARTRRSAALQLGAIGLTGGQARAAAVVETAVPVLAGVLGGALAALALARLAGPALGVRTIPVAAPDLLVPGLVALAAIGTGLIGTEARVAGRREPAAALRV